MDQPKDPTLWELLTEAVVDRRSADQMLEQGAIAVMLEIHAVKRADGTTKLVVRPRRKR